MTAVLAAPADGWEPVPGARVPGWRSTLDDGVTVVVWEPTVAVGPEVDIIRVRPLDTRDVGWLAARLSEAHHAMTGRPTSTFEHLPAGTANAAVLAVEDAIDDHHARAPWDNQDCFTGRQAEGVLRRLLEIGWTPPPSAAP